MTDVQVAVLGAGPHGLAATAHLRRAGVDVHVIGDPMSFWRTMPIGMMLRSNWSASCIGEYHGPLSLDAYCAASGARLGTPVPLADFIEYGMWVQRQVAPDLDNRRVERLESDGDDFALSFEDGERLRARRVVVATGIAPFAQRPADAAGLPPELASHTSDHRDLSRFAARRVLVVGGGQSALESAALLREGGAEVEVVVREPSVIWLHGGKYQRRLGRAAPLLYAPTDVGPMGYSRLVAVPDLFRRLPRRVQDSVAHRSIRPAGAAWLPSRLTDVPIHLDTRIDDVRPVGSRLRVHLSDGSVRSVDHLMFGTGYKVDVSRYSFLAPALVARVVRVAGYPVLHVGLESSVPGLHFLGAPAARSYGPILRFVSGGWYAGQAVAATVSHQDRNRGRAGVSTNAWG